jgi:NAD(P)H-dependent FMN reductase
MILMLCASEGANHSLAQALMERASASGIPSELVRLATCHFPLYTTEAEGDGVPESVLALTRSMQQANGFVVIAPEYNGSLPPVLNNAIAWVSRSGGDDWRSAFGKKFAALATHSGGGGEKVLSAMRQQLEHLGCNCLARQLLTTYQKPLNPDSAQAVLDELWSLCSK